MSICGIGAAGRDILDLYCIRTAEFKFGARLLLINKRDFLAKNQAWHSRLMSEGQSQTLGQSSRRYHLEVR